MGGGKEGGRNEKGLVLHRLVNNVQVPFMNEVL